VRFALSRYLKSPLSPLYRRAARVIIEPKAKTAGVEAGPFAQRM
jgi:hypothetical protein